MRKGIETLLRLDINVRIEVIVLPLSLSLI